LVKTSTREWNFIVENANIHGRLCWGI